MNRLAINDGARRPFLAVSVPSLFNDTIGSRCVAI